MPTQFTLNGKPVSVDAPPTQRLLDVLRDDLRKTGTKEGCGEGECGSCTILSGGVPVNACLMMLGQAEGQDILTVEGLAKESGHLAPIQELFITEGGAQCGICTPGMLVAASALLEVNPNPAETEVKDALGGVLCRCTGYHNIVKAVQQGAAGMKA